MEYSYSHKQRSTIVWLPLTFQVGTPRHLQGESWNVGGDAPIQGYRRRDVARDVSCCACRTVLELTARGAGFSRPGNRRRRGRWGEYTCGGSAT